MKSCGRLSIGLLPMSTAPEQRRLRIGGQDAILPNMRPHLAVFLLIAGGSPGTAQNRFEPETNIACVERLPMPAYSAQARQARIEGTVTATVLLSPRALIEKITTDFASKTPKITGSLIQSVEDAIREAAFHTYCGDKTITLIFDFKIAGQPAAYGYPNKFWIVAEPVRQK